MSEGSKLRLLIITHESSISGAPILLINLLKVIKAYGYSIFIVIKRGGELQSFFQNLADSIVLKGINYQSGRTIFSKIFDFLGFRVRYYLVLKKAKSADIIISNTITNGRLLNSLKKLKKPVVTYVHELDSVIKYFNRHHDSDLSFQLSDAFFSPNEAVTNNLLKYVPREKIYPLNYYFPPVDEQLIFTKRAKRELFCATHGIPPNRFYVVGMGTASRRKGFDFFLSSCNILKSNNQDIHFVWIGDYINAEEKLEFNSFIAEYGLFGSLTITGFLPNANDNLLPFDILALTSREDPYPLVVIEAALLKIPSISFRGTGGMDFFIGEDCGFLLDNRSPEYLAEFIVSLKNTPALITQAGNKAHAKATKLHSNADLVIQQLGAALNSAMHTSDQVDSKP